MKRVIVNDSLQHNYIYVLSESEGEHFDPDFKPQLTPAEMLELGVFGGDYLNDCKDEYPDSWFKKARLSKSGYDSSLNYFQIKASQPLEVWQKKGWIYEEDPRGWFQWYCRYYMGRRIIAEDQRQIKRWKAIKRHIAQVKNACQPGDLACHRRQRQALLHWAYDSRKI